VRLVVAEPESTALRRFLRSDPTRASCALARVEVVRAVRDADPAAVTRARAVLERLELVRLDDALLDAAAEIRGPLLRSLDAIHLAAAITLSTGPSSVVTYDSRMREAARSLGLTVVSPK